MYVFTLFAYFFVRTPKTDKESFLQDKAFGTHVFYLCLRKNKWTIQLTSLTSITRLPILHAASSPVSATCWTATAIRPTDNDIKRTIGKTLEESFSILSGVTDTRQLAEFKKEYIKEADTHMTVNTVLFLENQVGIGSLERFRRPHRNYIHQIPLPHQGAAGPAFSRRLSWHHHRRRRCANAQTVAGRSVACHQATPCHQGRNTIHRWQYGRCRNRTKGRSGFCRHHARHDHRRRTEEIPAQENNEQPGRIVRTGIIARRCIPKEHQCTSHCASAAPFAVTRRSLLLAHPA